MASRAQAFRDFAATERIITSGPLDQLKGKRVVVDAEDFLETVLTSQISREPLLPALGGLPFALRKHVDAYIANFNENNNILKNPELLFHFSQNLTEIKLNLQENQTIGPETAPYSRSAANDARLVINPSILVTDYLCQVPQRKPWGSLITSVLVADLVFLRTLWAIVTFVASYFAKKQSPLANSCESCLRPFDEEGSQEKGKEAAFEPSEAENSITDDCGQSQRSTLLVQRTASRSSVHIERVAEQNS